MSKVKAAWSLAKAAGKAYKMGYKTSKSAKLSKQAAMYKNAGKQNLAAAAKHYKDATKGFGGLNSLNKAKRSLATAKKMGQTARVKAFDSAKLARAGKRVEAKGGFVKAAYKAGRATRPVKEFAVGYAVGDVATRAYKKATTRNKPLTFRQKAALKKAQLASAMKRKRG